MKKSLFLVAFLFAGIPAYAGDSPQKQSEVRTETKADAEAQSTIITGDTVQRRQFIGALPGTPGSPGPIPGYLLFDNSDWHLYRPFPYRILSMEEIGNMKRKFKWKDLWPGNWKDRVKVTVLSKTVEDNDDPIRLIDWWPKSSSYEDDKIIGVVTVIGDFLHPEELFLGLALDEAKKSTSTRRVAVRARLIKEGVTRGRSIGAGGGYSRIISENSDNDAIGFATGGVWGTNKVRAEDLVEFEVLCLNDGPTEAPKPEGPEKDTEREEEEESKNQQNVVVRVVVEQPKAPAPPAEIPQRNDIADGEKPRTVPDRDGGCGGMPEFAVYFDFDKSNIKPEFEERIKEFSDWLASHEACRVQVEGHACKAGTAGYNAALGRRRAKAVYDALLAHNRSIEGRVVEQFVSLSEDKSSSEYSAEDRRVVVRVIGESSAK